MTAPDLLVDQLAEATPAVAVGFLDSLEDSTLLAAEPEQLVEVVACWERILSRATAAQAAAIRALSHRMAEPSRPGRRLDPDAETAEEVAWSLRVSSATGGDRVAFAHALTTLPRVDLALRDGRLGPSHARVLADCLTGLDPDLDDLTRERLERHLVARACSQRLTPAQLRRQAQRLVAAADPAGAAERRRRARRTRDVTCRGADDGMAWLSAYLPAEAAAACLGVVDAHARRTLEDDPDDARGLGARRADALVNLLLTGRPDGDPPDGAPVPATVDVHVDVTVSLAALAGVTGEPGEIAGLGLVDAELVRRLVHHPDATWRRLVTDPLTGSLLDVGTTRYRPPAPLARHVRLRDVTCRWPGCLCPAERSDLDHTVPWPDGPTSAENLTALCRRHHRLKTLGRYRVERSGRGETVVVGPLGRQLITTPHDYRPPPVLALAGSLSRPATATDRRGEARAPG